MALLDSPNRRPELEDPRDFCAEEELIVGLLKGFVINPTRVGVEFEVDEIDCAGVKVDFGVE